MQTPESRIKAPVRKWLRSIGAYVFSPVQMGIGSPTLDDLVCLPGGRFLAIEYKAPGKIPTPRQDITIHEIKKAGGLAIWGDSVEMIKEQILRIMGAE